MDKKDLCSEPDCCQPAPPDSKGRQRIKLLVFILVMLAAAGVGAYTLFKGIDSSESGEPPVLKQASAQPTTEKGIEVETPVPEVTGEVKPARGGCDCAKNLPPDELPPCMRQPQPSCVK